LFNGFQKNTQKTPAKEIELALELKKDYFNSNRKTSKFIIKLKNNRNFLSHKDLLQDILISSVSPGYSLIGKYVADNKKRN